MATVTSLTEQRIVELMAGWNDVLTQYNDIVVRIAELRNYLDSQGAYLDEFRDVTVPQLRQEVAGNAIQVSELADMAIPNMEAELASHEAELLDLRTVVLPTLEADLASTAQNVLDSPRMYEDPEPPTDPDDDLRPLRVGDVWFDTDDGNKQYMWNGTEWSTFAVDIPDLSITVAKLNTSTHMIY